MSFAKLFFVILLFVTITAHADTNLLTVDKGMLFWQPRKIYTTQSQYKLQAPVYASGQINGKSGELSGTLQIYCNLEYETRWRAGTADQGEAERYYKKAEASRIECPADITVKGLSLMERAKMRLQRTSDWVFKKNTNLLGGTVVNQDGGTILVKYDLTDTFNEYNLVKEEMEVMPALRNKAYILRWRTSTAMRNAALNVIDPHPQNEGDVVNENVRNVINKEARLIYNMLTGSRDKISAGDCWAIESSCLNALLPPQMQAHGGFSGKVIVRAQKEQKSRPPIEHWRKFEGNPRNPHEPFNAYRLTLVEEGTVNGFTERSTIKFKTMTTDNSSVEVALSLSKNTDGELWLDEDRQMIRHVWLRVNQADYSGQMPKVGKLADDVKAVGKISQEFVYDVKVENDPDIH